MGSKRENRHLATSCRAPVINDVLDFSNRIGLTGHLSPPFQVRSELEKLIKPLVFKAAAKGVPLTFEMDANRQEAIEVDSHRLSHVFSEFD
jgi:hypothetical protein